MKTILDSCKYLYLDELHYKEGLEMIVSEGIVSEETHSMKVGDITMNNLHPMGQVENRRLFKIVFDYDRIINFQVIKESFDTLDKNETNDTDGFLRVVTNSQYIEFVRKHHGWYKDIHEREADHYRLCLLNEIIDIMSLEPPSMELIKNS